MVSILSVPAAGNAAGIGVVETRFEHFEEPLELKCGDTLSEFTLAWEQYGELNAARDNAVLLFHALTGSHHAAGTNHGVPGLGNAWTDEMVLGWWHEFIGPGRAIDTDRSLRHLRQLHRGLLRIDRTAVDRSGHRRALGSLFPPCALLGLGPRGDAPRRPAGDRCPARGDRAVDGRHGRTRSGRHVPGACTQCGRGRGRHGGNAAPADSQLRADSGDRQRSALR